jgi:hypothetical protein
MNWAEFFSELGWFIVIGVVLDVCLLDGLFTSAIATRISGDKDKD